VASLVLLATASAASAADPDVETAREHFRRGREFFEAGKFTDALHEFEEAYRIKALPDFQYNIGLCDERLGRFEEAIAAYRRFIAGTLKQEDIAEATRRVVDLEEKIRASKAPEKPAPVPAPAPAPEHPNERSFAAPIALAAATLAVAVVGTALVGSVASDYGPLKDQWMAQPSPSLQQRARDLEARADAGYALWAIAGAAAIVDAILWARAARRPDRARAWNVSPAGFSAVLRF